MDLPPPGSALVPFLLVLAAPTPGSCCSFGFNPVSSTFSAHLNKLTPWLLLDYPVAMPSNLEPDSACSDLWGLHFGALALRRMIGVAGKDLAPLLKTLLAQLQFVDECHIQDPQGCVRLETVNVSQLLETLAQHLRGLQGRPPHFPGCARLRCHPGPALTSPAARHEGTLGTRQGAPSPAGHGLVLLGGVGGALGLVAAAWVLWRRPCAQVTGSTEDTGSTGEHWEVTPLSPPSPPRDPRHRSRTGPEWPSGTWGQTQAGLSHW